MMQQVQARAVLFEAVHWQLRHGFCRCLAGLSPVQDGRRAAQDEHLLRLLALADGCEMLHHAERQALAGLRHPADSSLGNRDLLWAANLLKQKVGAVRAAQPGARPDALQDLRRYLALFMGELLVQLHAKEVEVQRMLAQQLSPGAMRELQDDLAELAIHLHRGSGEDA